VSELSHHDLPGLPTVTNARKIPAMQLLPPFVAENANGPQTKPGGRVHCRAIGETPALRL